MFLMDVRFTFGGRVLMHLAWLVPATFKEQVDLSGQVPSVELIANINVLEKPCTTGLLSDTDPKYDPQLNDTRTIMYA